MTQEEKQLLLKDLCARLPYGVKCCARYNTGNKYTTNLIAVDIELGTVVTRINELHSRTSSIVDDIRPYLHPMSSMTEEEREELCELCEFFEPYNDRDDFSHYGIEIIEEFCVNDEKIPLREINYKVIDWLNAHHFDYCSLIKKGLALEAPEEMYKTE